MAQKANDPYTSLLRRNALPLSLLVETTSSARPKILSTESYDHTFGPKAQRKRPRLQSTSLSELATAVDEQETKYNATEDTNLLLNHITQDGTSAEASDAVFQKGQSKRIWGELYKVIDSSDVLIHVLDARDPLGTRCDKVVSFLKKEAAHKHLIYVLNKCDLIPSKATVILFPFQ